MKFAQSRRIDMGNYCIITAVSAIITLVVPAAAEAPYDPKIDAAMFSTKIDNPLFSMPIGKTLIYQSKSKDGIGRLETAIPGETRTIMGVETLLYQDTDYLNGQIEEVTRDYIAQDRDGNVWYFGEEVDRYENGKFKDSKGSWIASVDGAKPGIWMKAKQVVGDSYRQEYYKGEAEDWAKNVLTDETVTVLAGTFKHCTKTFEWTPLEPASKSNKFNCPEAGGTVLDQELKNGNRVELIEVKRGG
jgi:hypothetical protein